MTIIFESREARKLRKENEILREEIVRLTREICDLDLKLYDTCKKERAEKLAAELELTSQQRSKLGSIFSIERARWAGVPEDSILHDHDEIDDTFSSRES